MISILIPSGVFLGLYWARYLWNVFRRGQRIPLALPLLFTCLFIPKINLIQVNPDLSMAGIRTDDFLALLLLIIALFDPKTWKNKKILIGVGLLAAMTAAGVVSMLSGRANGFDNEIKFSIFSILRKGEYFAFALIGIYLARKSEAPEKTALTEFTWMFGMHLVIGTLQALGVCNYAALGFADNPRWFQNMAVSTFNGHYEYGHFLCYAIVIYLCVFLRTRKAAWLGLCAAAFGMIVLTKSRSSLMIGLILIALIPVFSVRSFRQKWVRMTIYGGLVLAAAAGILLAAGAVNVGNFGKVNLAEYAETLGKNVEIADLHRYADNIKACIPIWDYIPIVIDDASASERFFKWGNALSGFLQYPLFGYGNGVTEVMDGNYVKLLGENGLVGTLLWLGMYGYYLKIVWDAKKRTRMARSVVYMMVSVLIASLFIDMFEASRPMETLWLAVGLVIGTCMKDEPQERCLTEDNG